MKVRWLGLAVAAVLLGGAVAYAALKPAPDLPRGPIPFSPTIAVIARPVEMQGAGRGRFHFAGGLELTSPDTERLHGLSDLIVTPDGRLLSESDNGDLLEARLSLGPSGRLIGLNGASLTPLNGETGAPLEGKEEGDAEGLALTPNGDLMVSFEQRHRIWIYPKGGGPPRAVDRPMVDMAANFGLEGLSMAPSQGPDAYWVGIETGAIFLCRLGRGCRSMVSLPKPPLGYRLSGLREAPDGQLLVLHHSWAPFAGSRVRLSVVEAPSTAPRAIDVLALSPPDPLDNFEGVAAVPGRDGGLRLYLISDDNFSDGQRTLLLAFDWSPRP